MTGNCETFALYNADGSVAKGLSSGGVAKFTLKRLREIATAAGITVTTGNTDNPETGKVNEMFDTVCGFRGAATGDNLLLRLIKRSALRSLRGKRAGAQIGRGASDAEDEQGMLCPCPCFREVTWLVRNLPSLGGPGKPMLRAMMKAENRRGYRAQELLALSKMKLVAMLRAGELELEDELEGEDTCVGQDHMEQRTREDASSDGDTYADVRDFHTALSHAAKLVKSQTGSGADWAALEKVWRVLLGSNGATRGALTQLLGCGSGTDGEIASASASHKLQLRRLVMTKISPRIDANGEAGTGMQKLTALQRFFVDLRHETDSDGLSKSQSWIDVLYSRVEKYGYYFPLRTEFRPEEYSPASQRAAVKLGRVKKSEAEVDEDDFTDKKRCVWVTRWSLDTDLKLVNGSGDEQDLECLVTAATAKGLRGVRDVWGALRELFLVLLHLETRLEAEPDNREQERSEEESLTAPAADHLDGLVSTLKRAAHATLPAKVACGWHVERESNSSVLTVQARKWTRFDYRAYEERGLELERKREARESRRQEHLERFGKLRKKGQGELGGRGIALFGEEFRMGRVGNKWKGGGKRKYTGSGGGCRRDRNPPVAVGLGQPTCFHLREMDKADLRCTKTDPRRNRDWLRSRKKQSKRVGTAQAAKRDRHLQQNLARKHLDVRSYVGRGPWSFRGRVKTELAEAPWKKLRGDRKYEHRVNGRAAQRALACRRHPGPAVREAVARGDKRRWRERLAAACEHYNRGRDDGSEDSCTDRDGTDFPLAWDHRQGSGRRGRHGRLRSAPFGA